MPSRYRTEELIAVTASLVYLVSGSVGQTILQGCGSGSGLDPDSVTLWIRIRTGIGNPDPDPGARKLRNFSGKMHFLVIKKKKN
jgi:hypothetical protein